MNTSIYGKIYFPTRSNGLKDLGRFLGATWSNIDSSGLQSLVWRHFWHENNESKYKKLLLTYNREDCEASVLLLNELLKISTDAADRTDIDFVDQPKQNATLIGHEVHDVLESAIRYAHADYNKKRVVIREKKDQDASQDLPKTVGAPRGHQAYQRIVPLRVNKTIRVESQKICPDHEGLLLKESSKLAERLIIDLHFTRNGCRKTLTIDSEFFTLTPV